MDDDYTDELNELHVFAELAESLGVREAFDRVLDAVAALLDACAAVTADPLDAVRQWWTASGAGA